jgi:hypothetical protein
VGYFGFSPLLEPPPFVGIPAPTNAPTIAAMVLAIKNLLSKPRITIIGTMRHTASAKRICGPIPLAEPVRKTIAAQPPPTKIAAISVAGVPWWAWGGRHSWHCVWPRRSVPRSTDGRGHTDHHSCYGQTNLFSCGRPFCFGWVSTPPCQSIADHGVRIDDRGPHVDCQALRIHSALRQL